MTMCERERESSELAVFRLFLTCRHSESFLKMFYHVNREIKVTHLNKSIIFVKIKFHFSIEMKKLSYERTEEISFKIYFLTTYYFSIYI